VYSPQVTGVGIVLLAMHARNTIQAGTLRDRRRGGAERARTLSPGRRREIASFARFIRKQKEQGQTTATEQMQRTIQIVRAENPDLASFLKITSRMPMKYSERLSQALTVEEKQIIERAWQRVVSE
jgi:hypothetical protein